jgi:heme A synthase
MLSTVLAAIGAVTVTSAGAEEPNLTAYRAAFVAAAAMALIGALLALQVPDADAAETMQHPARPVRKTVAAD